MTLSAVERRRLLQVAREAIAAAVAPPRFESPAFSQGGSPGSPSKSGAFVSLHRRGDGELRGCIGCFEGRGTLPETVARMAVEAALRDPRFQPVGVAELDDLLLEISVLSPMEDVVDPRTIEVGKHGLVVSRSGCRGVLLPQVATEYRWTREQFLDHTCLKAGLEAGAWRKPGTRLQTFTAEVFSDQPS